MDEVFLMVSPLNPFKEKDPDLLDDTFRLQLARKAVAHEPHISVSDYEFRLPRPTYTWNTLRHLTTDYPDRQFLLIIGSDNWLSFPRWAHHEELLARYPIIIYPRKGYPVDASSLPPSVRLVETPLYPVSSTLIRERVRHHEDISQLVPENIVEDVERLYRNA